MKVFAGTPRPWKLRLRPDFIGRDMLRRRFNVTFAGPMNEYIVATEVGEDDGRLIAVAPDQHEVLLAFVEWADNHDSVFVYDRAGYEPDGGYLHDDDGWRALVDQARAVIAKAISDD